MLVQGSTESLNRTEVILPQGCGVSDIRDKDGVWRPRDSVGLVWRPETRPQVALWELG
ncbi:hypothetical protein FEMY_24910 [Ferrovum myxofaciens]|uniref:Uncharacterized protein n=1 Tax=Ferrovum myxofaciens TaxID=416213 RepID=A0A149VUU4_9PROT|nr:hypothetical protein FEMY_24910 [Ferrovum myxofaciens]